MLCGWSGTQTAIVRSYIFVDFGTIYAIWHGGTSCRFRFFLYWIKAAIWKEPCKLHFISLNEELSVGKAMGLVLNFKAGLKFNIAACFSPFCFSSNFSCWKSIKQKHDYGLFGPTGGSTHAFFPLGLNRKIYLGCWYFFALHPRKHLCVPSSLKWSKVRLVLFFFTAK